MTKYPDTDQNSPTFPSPGKFLFFPDIFLHGNPERISDYSLKYIPMLKGARRNGFSARKT